MAEVHSQYITNNIWHAVSLPLLVHILKHISVIKREMYAENASHFEHKNQIIATEMWGMEAKRTQAYMKWFNLKFNLKWDCFGTVSICF